MQNAKKTQHLARMLQPRRLTLRYAKEPFRQAPAARTVAVPTSSGEAEQDWHAARHCHCHPSQPESSSLILIACTTQHVRPPGSSLAAFVPLFRQCMASWGILPLSAASRFMPTCDVMAVI